MAVSVSRIRNLGSSYLRKQRCSWELLQKRNFSSEPPGTVYRQPKLYLELPGLPKAIFASESSNTEGTKVTTLKNGLRVASENKFGQSCTVGVVIDSGSRYEVAYPSGISHFLEKLAFNSTSEFQDKDKILHALEKHGGICDCLASRDTFIYAASADRRGLDPVVRILGDVILRPKLLDEGIQIAKQNIKFELETLMTRPEQETILTDLIHAAAYRENTLGLPKICPQENVEKIDRSIVLKYLKNHYIPERMVVAGVGIEHEDLVRSVEKYFEDIEPIWEKRTKGEEIIDQSVAQYTGGLVQDTCQVPQHMGPSGLPELAHIVVGLEGCSHQDKDFIPMCVLSMMMGGGGSFSAGGPGKGMYTRLYTNVLNRYHWMFSATAYNQTYSDTGLFYIHASAPPKYVKEMVEVITREMAAMGGRIDNIELRRAKTQLQSMILMNLEARPVMFEDIGRQVLATGTRKTPSTFIEQIENLTNEDIQRVASRLLRSQPSVAARGDVAKLPSLSHIQSCLMEKDVMKSHGKGRSHKKIS